jgi:hypothetical protein
MERNMIRINALTLVLAAFGSSVAAAQAPAQLPMQGFLTDAGGTAIDQEVTIVFSVYDADTGGTALFAETQTVMVENGFFSADIGAVQPLDLALFRDNGTTFLGIQVGADPEMTPRMQLGSVPYAAVAEYANQVDPTRVQTRVAGTCPAGQAIQTINQDGSVTCQTAGATGAFDLMLVTTSMSIGAGSEMFSVEAACPAGRQIFTGSCHPGGVTTNVIINQYPNLDANAWRCGFRNTGGAASTVYTYAVCRLM